MSNSKKNSEKKNRKSLDSIRPDTELLKSVTDRYFLRTKEIVSKFGDTEVTYANTSCLDETTGCRCLKSWAFHIQISFNRF